MKAQPIIDALAALRAIKDAPANSVPFDLWRGAMYAHNVLESELAIAGLRVPVEGEATQPQRVAA